MRKQYDFTKGVRGKYAGKPVSIMDAQGTIDRLVQQDDLIARQAAFIATLETALTRIRGYVTTLEPTSSKGSLIEVKATLRAIENHARAALDAKPS